MTNVTQSQIDSLEAGISAAMTALQGQIASQVYAQSVPLLGSGLQTAYNTGQTALATVTSLGTALSNGLASLNSAADYAVSAVQSAIDSALANLGLPAGLISITFTSDGVEVSVTHSQATNHTQALDSAIGVAGLGLTTAGMAALTTTTAVDLTFGVDLGGFYVDTTNGNEIDLTINGTVQSLTADATIGFLNFNVADEGSAFAGTFDLNLQDANNDGFLRLNELATDMVDATLSGTADIRLALSTDMGTAALPSASADLWVDWDFSATTVDPVSGNPAVFGNLPSMEFRDVTIDLGSFINNFVRPFLEQIAPVLNVIDKALGILDADIQLLHNVPNWETALDLNSDGKINFLDLLKKANPSLDTQPLQDFITLTQRLLGWTDFLDSVSFSGAGFSLGNFSLGAGADIRTLGFDLANASRVYGGAASNLQSIINTLSGAGWGAADPESGMSGQDIMLSIANDGDFSLPIFTDPNQIFNLLAGGDADLMQLDLPTVSLMVSNPAIFTIPAYPGVNFVGGGGLGVAFDLGFGFDTRGLTMGGGDPAQLINGLFLVDGPNPEVALSATINIGASLDILIASIYGGGDLTGEINLDLADIGVTPGRLYLDEVLARLTTNPFSLFDTSGKVSVGFNAYVTLGFMTVWKYSSPRLTLGSFNFDGADALAGPVPPVLGDVSGGVLTLNIGARANLRGIAENTDTDEAALIGAKGANTVVELFGHSESFAGVSQIVADGGEGNDELVLSTSLNIAASLSGGNGNDALIGGAAADSLYGGDGVDLLEGSGGDDSLVGGAGNDMLEGGAGRDTLDGGADTDSVSYAGSNAAVTVDGQTGAASGGAAEGDTLISIEIIEGSAHNDTLTAANAFGAALVGGAGDDSLTGGSDFDYLMGGTGHDRLYAGLGGADMVGGAGNDTYYVGSASDQVYDNKYGETAASGGGNDLVVSSISWSLDTAQMSDIERLQLTGLAVAGSGNALNNTLIGTSGQNELMGLVGEDTIEAGAGDDSLDGGDGNDTLRGQTGQDTLWGQDGNDALEGGDNDDLLYGGGGLDVLWGDDGNDSMEGGDHHDELFGGAGYDTLKGGDGDDALQGDGGNDLLEADAGDDTVMGGSGDDTLYGGSGVDGFAGEEGNDQFYVNDEYEQVVEAIGFGNDTVLAQVSWAANDGGEIEHIIADTSTGTVDFNLQGNRFAQRLVGAAGFDTLEGRGGADTLDGGDGLDLASYLHSAVGVAINMALASQVGGEAQGDVYINMEGVRGSNFDDTLLGGVADDFFESLDGNDSLTGGAGNDWLVGGAGNDTLDGGTNGFEGDRLHGELGDDTYYIDSGRDTTDEFWGNGYDQVFTTASLFDELGIGIEKLTLVSVTGLYGTGNELGNLIIGSVGNDVIDGSAGADTMEGGAGSDAYFVDQTGDQVVEGLNAGLDRVRTSINYTLGANLENLTLIGAAVSGTGNALNNQLRGNSADNSLSGGDGNDTLDVTDDAVIGTGNWGGNDTLIGGAGDDTYVTDGGDSISELAGGGIDTVKANFNYILGAELERLELSGSAISGTGNALANKILGNARNNSLNGMTGLDTLEGGAGNDIYVIDGGDVIIESASGGNDTVQSAASYGMADHLEVLELTGAALIGVGNGLANRISGTSVANTLRGGAGNDTLTGGDGNDTLAGDAGDDRLEGGNGVDTASYVGATSAKVNLSLAVPQSTGAGTDTLLSIENLISGAGNDSLTGSAGANRLEGGAGHDTLVGNGGNDVLIGGAGHDQYTFDGGDLIVELAGGGFDLVRATASYALANEVERLDLLGAAINGAGNNLANLITGNALANRLSGLAGMDTLMGGAGNDTITGGMGQDMMIGGDNADRFVFASVSETTASATTCDVISAFIHGVDKIDLSAIDAATGLPGNNPFVFKSAIGTTSAGEVVVKKVDLAGTANDYTLIFLDTDSDKAAEGLIRLTGLVGLTVADFIL